MRKWCIHIFRKRDYHLSKDAKQKEFDQFKIHFHFVHTSDASKSKTAKEVHIRKDV